MKSQKKIQHVDELYHEKINVILSVLLLVQTFAGLLIIIYLSRR